MVTTLYILCGLPGSGKSTWIDKYLKETGFGILKPGPFVRVVSRDEVRFSMINTEAAENNDKEYFSREKEVYDEFINRIVEGIEDPYCGILGSTFFQKYRYVLNFDELVAYSMV